MLKRVQNFSSPSLGEMDSSVKKQRVSETISSVNTQTHSLSRVSTPVSLAQWHVMTTAIACAGSWNNQMGDIVPQLITRLPNWPAERALVIHAVDKSNETVHYYTASQEEHGAAANRLATAHDVHIRLSAGHYDAIVGEQADAVRSIVGDGDCFYNAVLTALSAHDRQQARELGAHADALRAQMVRYVRMHPQQLSPFLDQTDAAKPCEFQKKYLTLDLWTQITSYLDVGDVGRLARVNRAFAGMMRSDIIWFPRLTPLARQQIQTVVKAGSTTGDVDNTHTENKNPSSLAYTQFVSSPLFRQGLSFAGVNDQRAVIRTVAMKLFNLFLQHHPTLLACWIRADMVLHGTFNVHADSLENRYFLLQGMARGMVEKNIPMALVEHWLAMPVNELSSPKLIRLRALLTYLPGHFDRVFLTRLMESAEIDEVRFDMVIKGHKKLQTELASLDTLQQRDFFAGNDYQQLLKWCLDCQGVDVTQLGEIFDVLSAHPWHGRPPCLAALATHSALPMQRLKGLLMIAIMAPRAFFDAYQGLWNTLSDERVASLSVHKRLALLLSGTHKHHAEHIPIAHLDDIFKFVSHVDNYREFDDVVGSGVKTYPLNFADIPKNLHAFFVQMLGQTTLPSQREQLGVLARIATLAPGLGSHIIDALATIPQQQLQWIADSEACLDALTKNTLTVEKLQQWFAPDRRLSQARLQSMVCWRALGKVNSDVLDLWANNRLINDAAFNTLLTKMLDVVPSSPTQAMQVLPLERKMVFSINNTHALALEAMVGKMIDRILPEHSAFLLAASLSSVWGGPRTIVLANGSIGQFSFEEVVLKFIAPPQTQFATVAPAMPTRNTVNAVALAAAYARRDRLSEEWLVPASPTLGPHRQLGFDQVVPTLPLGFSQ